jgi:ethylbenzene hydroxylase subunit beta/complex iron-sulfur molybdoenzyme family reductase subunit beta
MGGGFRDGVAQPGRLPTRREFGEAWKFNFEETFRGGKGTEASLRPQGDKPEWGPNWDEDQGGGKYPNAFYFYLPRICNHCTHPACLEACPYKKIYFNQAKKISQKCILCFPRVEQAVAPACARQCPGRVRFVGYRDDENGPIYKLVDEWKVALPLHPEYGTEPNFFYVPPIAPASLDERGNIDTSTPRIPDQYLVSLFGPAVLEALGTLKSEMKKKREGLGSQILDTLIAYEWTGMFSEFDRDPASLERPPV